MSLFLFSVLFPESQCHSLVQLQRGGGGWQAQREPAGGLSHRRASARLLFRRTLARRNGASRRLSPGRGLISRSPEQHPDLIKLAAGARANRARGFAPLWFQSKTSYNKRRAGPNHLHDNDNDNKGKRKGQSKVSSQSTQQWMRWFPYTFTRAPRMRARSLGEGAKLRGNVFCTQEHGRCTERVETGSRRRRRPREV